MHTAVKTNVLEVESNLLALSECCRVIAKLAVINASITIRFTQVSPAFVDLLANSRHDV